MGIVWFSGYSVYSVCIDEDGWDPYKKELGNYFSYIIVILAILAIIIIIPPRIRKHMLETRVR